MQIALTILTVSAAFIYLGNKVYKSLTTTKGCNKGCGGACSSIDYSKLDEIKWKKSN